ncbi:MAG: SRPBCC family protein [Ilumatobacteraceae bacterium]
MTEALSDENFELRIVHRVPIDLVFAAMTEPEHLTHFWGPAGTRTPVENITVDLRPGGVFETTMVSEATGDTYTMHAVYVDVVRPHYLSWRDSDVGVLTELSFRDLGDGTTEVVTTQRGLPPEHRTPQARAGWETALDRNASYLASLTAPPLTSTPRRPESQRTNRRTTPDAS